MRRILDKKGVGGATLVTFVATIVIVIVLVIFASGSAIFRKLKGIKGEIMILDEEHSGLEDIFQYSKYSLIKWGCSGTYFLSESETIKEGKCVCDANKGWVSKYHYGTFDPPCIQTGSRKDGVGRISLRYSSDYLAKVVEKAKTEEEIKQKCPEWRYYDLIFITGTFYAGGYFSGDGRAPDTAPACDVELNEIKGDVMDFKIFEIIPGKQTATFKDYRIGDSSSIEGGKDFCCYAYDKERF